MHRSRFTVVTVLIICTVAFSGMRGIFGTHTVFADQSLQQQIDAANQQIATLNQQITQYKQQISQADSNKHTLQNALDTIGLQSNEVQAEVQSTQSKISSISLQIQQLQGQIDQTKQNIATYKKMLANYIQTIQQQSDNESMVYQLLSANDMADFWQNVNTTLDIQSALEKKSQKLQSEEKNLAAAQQAVQMEESALQTQNQSLLSQQQQLSATAQMKNQLLVETNAQESTYQQLLAQAQAQLNSFSTFVRNAGGDAIVGNETVCDSWGCYYNQRDSAWGNDSLNGTQYTLASDGCLVTAMAMVMTHYGYRNVTPATIDHNPGNFAAYYPAYLLYTINVDGVSATRVGTEIDSSLAAGDPVIVGLYAFGGTHYVVLVSGSNGNYVMKDPYFTNGNNENFSARYDLSQIFSIQKVAISG